MLQFQGRGTELLQLYFLCMYLLHLFRTLFTVPHFHASARTVTRRVACRTIYPTCGRPDRIMEPADGPILTPEE